MSLELKPATDALRGRQSCVYELRRAADGLSVFVETYADGSADCINYVVTFEHERGFLILDDADLPSWLSFPALASGHILYEVCGDGWLHAQPSGSLAVASAQCREWLVVTGNECVSVFSAADPSIQRLDHAAA